MSVKILSSSYLNGMQCLDYKIEINGIVIALSKNDFSDLTKAISEKLNEDYEKVVKVKNRYDKDIEAVSEFRKDILKCFWDGDFDDLDAFIFKKSITEMQGEEIYSVLNKWSNFLGLE